MSETNKNNIVLDKYINKIIIDGGSDYPPINDPNFQKDIKKIFSKFVIKKEPSFKEFCFPEKFTYQLPQVFVADFINPDTPYKGILLYHKIGAGKTCAAVNIAEQWKHKKKIMFVCPASLVGNMYKELRTPCAGTEYISEKERKQLSSLEPDSDEYIDLIETVNKRIDKYYTIISYNKFVDLSQKRKIDITNYILIIDEVQNVVSETGTYYKTFYKEIHKAPSSLRVVIMSATPIFDKPIELALTMNLLKPKEEIPINPTFNDTFLQQTKNGDNIDYQIKNPDKLQKMLAGYVSYFKGAPSYVFPKRIGKVVKCRMSKYQYSCYKTVLGEEGGIKIGDIMKLPNNFYIGTRMISNVAFPNRLIKEEGYNAFKGRFLKEELEKYSTKFYKILKNIKRSPGPVFVYSSFREYGGIQSFIKVLEANGFKDLLGHGEGRNRYAVWSGDEKATDKEYARDIYNKKDNFDGSKLKVILGSPAIKEGVSLLRTRQIHIMEPYWNMSRLEQVIGRGFRFCSHKDLNKEDREIQVFIYISVDPSNKKLTVDKLILDMAHQKNELTKQFEQVIKDAAVDRYLFNN
jgi:superfamily II DNA or RNA helicase